MIKLIKGNVVRVVDSEEKAKVLEGKGFVRVPETTAKKPKEEKPKE